MEIKAWTVKTRTGMIIPSWIFDTEDEAKEFLDELEEHCRPHKNYVVEVLIKTLSRL